MVDFLLDDLTDRGKIATWTCGTYEPKIVAFGGPNGFDIAHTTTAGTASPRATIVGTVPILGRRETTTMLLGTLVRAAGLGWFEQGDVWAHVATLWPIPPADTGRAVRIPKLGPAMRRLMT